MRTLILFLLRFKTLFLFLGLELISFMLIVKNNQFQRNHFLSSSNVVVGTVYNLSDKVYKYFSLASVNEDLALENEELNTELVLLREQVAFYRQDSSYQGRRYYAVEKNYTFVSAKVIHFSTARQKNMFTINKGTSDGVKVGMGVVNGQGVVGIVRNTSSHFASVLPIINTDSKTSATVKNKTQLGTMYWKGGDVRYARLEEVPLYIPVVIGDTIVTSVNSYVFPEGYRIGKVTSFTERNDNFYDIEVKLAVDFDKLSYVDVINFEHAAERDSLELGKEQQND